MNSTKETIYIDKVRAAFLQCIINLLGDYRKFISINNNIIVTNEDDLDYPFNKTQYLESLTYLSSQDKLFMNALISTQLFSSFVAV